MVSESILIFRPEITCDRRDIPTMVLDGKQSESQLAEE
jgi:hypothetical protein